MASVTTRQVQGSWSVWDNDKQETVAARGQVIFWPSNFVVISADNTVVAERPIVVGLDENGNIDAALPITDDSRYDPTPFTYHVVERINGTTLREYDLSLPDSASALELSTQLIDS